jgi:RpiR family transcriptional regulator, carbohydrate utilization regulator
MLDRIRASIPALPPAEQRVARLLLADPRSFATLPVGELAERAHVSKPTVVRFCRSVGYDGLADFKLKLAGSVNEGVPFVHRAVDDDDKAGDLVVKVIDNAVAAMLRYRNAAASHAFERAIAALAEAGAAAAGASSSTASATRASWRRTRSTSSSAWASRPAVSDGHVQVMSATMLKPGDCAVIISNSGRSRDLLDVAEIARRKGATVIVITASGSPLALLAQRPAQQHPAGRRPPRGRRPLQPDGVAAAAPADHRHPDHRRGAAPGLGALRPMLQEIKRNLRAKRYVARRRTPE